jgi:hypothetical protein
MAQPPVLIISIDPLTAALLGAAIELAGASPVFPTHAEAPRDALRRLRPAMVFVDCEDERSCADTFLGPVMMTGAIVVVFRSSRARHDVSELANRLGIRSITLPDDGELIHSLVGECLERTSARRGPS